MPDEDPRPGDIESMLSDFAALLWRRGEDDQGMAMDVDLAIFQEEGSFRDLGHRTRQEGTLLVELEWISSGDSVSDVDRDFYRLAGWFAEETLFIHRRIDRDAIVYEVVVGSLHGARHLHRVRFRITGNRASTVLAGHRRRAQERPI